QISPAPRFGPHSDIVPPHRWRFYVKRVWWWSKGWPKRRDLSHAEPLKPEGLQPVYFGLNWYQATTTLQRMFSRKVYKDLAPLWACPPSHLAATRAARVDRGGSSLGCTERCRRLTSLQM
ncbi:unnamed protein product, partial [Pylaiella littoralis]